MKKALVFLIILCAYEFSLSQKMLIHNSDGSIDNYNISEVDSITFIDSTAIFDSLIAYYPFNGNATDLSGNGNDGTLLGSATATTFLTIGDNSIDYMRIPYTVANNLTNFTFSTMLKINALHSSGSLSFANTFISGAASFHPGGNGFNITYDANIQKWRILLVPPFQVNYFFDTNSVVEDNNWHHIAVTRENNTAKLYIDGLQVGNPIIVPSDAIVVDMNGFLIGQDQDFVGGGFDSFQSFAGNIDNLRIYGKALSYQEIQLIYSIDGY
ncbi:MAG: LamG domain-containing protein [Calditrichaeota bacterium]|nr:MAG: LamG domain-containing protein [Calditrichota bacterium]